MTEREALSTVRALKLALEALEKSHICPLLPDDCSEAITAIKEALMSDTDGAQPEQEPVALVYDPITGSITPLQRKPLTDEEIILIVAECASSHQHTDIHFARAIERAHGIKELKEYKK